MTTEIDLRDHSVDEYRPRLFEVLTEAGNGDTYEIVAAEDVDPHLVRYQFEHDRALEWEYADPDAEPRDLQLIVGESLDGALGTIDVLDLRSQRRHGVLLEIFDELDASKGFVLVNDHDPKPLYHELSSMHGDVVTSYDVREIPKRERHPTIHHRYGMISEGGTMEIIAPHEPWPLRQEFDQQYGDSFEWEIVDQEPGECRVHITRQGAAGDGANDESVSLEIIEELDVRDLPPAQRHEKIFDEYADLTGRDRFVLVNDHDPKPLYHQFDAEAGPEFRWEYRKKEPGEFRVLIGKTETADAASGSNDAASATSDSADAPF